MSHRSMSRDTPSPRGLPRLGSNADGSRQLRSGSHQRRSLRRQPTRSLCSSLRCARRRAGGYHSPGTAHCGHARRLSGPGWRPRGPDCKTIDRPFSETHVLPSTSRPKLANPAGLEGIDWRMPVRTWRPISGLDRQGCQLGWDRSVPLTSRKIEVAKSPGEMLLCWPLIWNLLVPRGSAFSPWPTPPVHPPTWSHSTAGSSFKPAPSLRVAVVERRPFVEL